MKMLPHLIYLKLERAGFNSLDEIVEYMDVRGKPRCYRLQCIPDIGAKSAKIIADHHRTKNKL